MAVDAYFERSAGVELRSDHAAVVLQVLFYAAIAHFIGLLLFTLNQPLLDLQLYRQTMTALSVFSMLNDGGWLIYQTPMVGAPWTVPLEFPIYQWLVALLALGSPLEIDAAGRVIAATFALACLGPARSILHSLEFDRRVYHLFGALYLFAPIYAFWGRAFMIESTAIFFGLLWLATYIRFLLAGSALLLGVALVSAAAAALTKASTFPAFVFAGAAFTVYHAYSLGSPRAAIGRYLLACTTVTVALAFAFAWVAFSDAYKIGNPLVESYRADQLFEWRYGKFEQRFSIDLWWGTIIRRSLFQASGLGWLAAVGVFAYIGWRDRRFWAAGVALISFIIPFLLFSSLHMHAQYYQNANAIFLIAVMVFVFSTIMYNSEYRKLFYAILALTIVTDLMVFYKPVGYGSSIIKLSGVEPTLLVADAVRHQTSDRGAVVVTGLNGSPEVHYYAQRKGVALPYWAPPDMIHDLANRTETWMGGAPLGAIVDCNPTEDWSQPQRVEIDNFISRYANRSIEVSKDCTIYLGENG